VGWRFLKLVFPGQANATLPHRGKKAPIPVAKAKRVGKIRTDHCVWTISQKTRLGKEILQNKDKCRPLRWTQGKELRSNALRALKSSRPCLFIHYLGRRAGEILSAKSW
jgi:hypothetical protein